MKSKSRDELKTKQVPEVQIAGTNFINDQYNEINLDINS